MGWVTREHARVDRIACPWLISRFIAPPDFRFVPAGDVMAVAEREGAIPYDALYAYCRARVSAQTAASGPA